MQAIILAAGIGNRLGEESGNRPKSLLEFDGKSLLQRHIEILLQNEVTDITLVVGYQANVIEDHLDSAPVRINYIHNPRFTEGSIISLGCAESVLLNEPEFLLMDADVLYDPTIVKRLIETDKQNCLLIDREFMPGDEPVKVCIDKHNRIIDFRKQPATTLDIEIMGESVGFFKFNNKAGKKLNDRIQHYLERGENETPYEEAIRDCLLSNPELFDYEDITGLPWIEIDFPEDIIRARTKILPDINN